MSDLTTSFQRQESDDSLNDILNSLDSDVIYSSHSSRSSSPIFTQNTTIKTQESLLANQLKATKLNRKSFNEKTVQYLNENKEKKVEKLKINQEKTWDELIGETCKFLEAERRHKVVRSEAIGKRSHHNCKENINKSMLSEVNKENKVENGKKSTHNYLNEKEVFANKNLKEPELLENKRGLVNTQKEDYAIFEENKEVELTEHFLFNEINSCNEKIKFNSYQQRFQETNHSSDKAFNKVNLECFSLLSSPFTHSELCTKSDNIGQTSYSTNKQSKSDNNKTDKFICDSATNSSSCEVTKPIKCQIIAISLSGEDVNEKSSHQKEINAVNYEQVQQQQNSVSGIENIINIDNVINKRTVVNNDDLLNQNKPEEYYHKENLSLNKENEESIRKTYSEESQLNGSFEDTTDSLSETVSMHYSFNDEERRNIIDNLISNNFEENIHSEIDKIEENVENVSTEEDAFSDKVITEIENFFNINNNLSESDKNIGHCVSTQTTDDCYYEKLLDSGQLSDEQICAEEIENEKLSDFNGFDVTSCKMDKCLSHDFLKHLCEQQKILMCNNLLPQHNIEDKNEIIEQQKPVITCDKDIIIQFLHNEQSYLPNYTITNIKKDRVDDDEKKSDEIDKNLMDETCNYAIKKASGEFTNQQFNIVISQDKEAYLQADNVKILANKPTVSQKDKVFSLQLENKLTLLKTVSEEKGAFQEQSQTELTYGETNPKVMDDKNESINFDEDIDKNTDLKMENVQAINEVLVVEDGLDKEENSDSEDVYDFSADEGECDISNRGSNFDISESERILLRKGSIRGLCLKENDAIAAFLDQSNTTAEARLLARRQARAEAREIRMRDLERQQKEQEENADRQFDMLAEPITRAVRTKTNHYLSSRRSSEDSLEDGGSIRELRHEFKEVEEKFRKAMIANAQLDNDKSAQTYQLELLKDRLEELEEEHSQLKREHRDKCRAHDQLTRVTNKLKEDLAVTRAELDERDRLIKEKGLVIVCEDIPEDGGGDGNYIPKKALVSVENAHLLESAGEGSLDVRLAKFGKEKGELQDQISHLKLELEEERSKRSKSSGSLLNGPNSSTDYDESQREVSKQLAEYKFRAQKAEQDVATLQATVARLESQVIRYKSAAEMSEKSEEALKLEKRKLQREAREAVSRAEELETSNKHLVKRLDKLKNAKSALLKEL